MSETRCGFVGVIGLPNAGKSTLVNALVGQKISIVSRKVQTTRTRILAIALHETEDMYAQIVLLDTPGFFKPQKTLERAMVGAAHDVMAEAEILIHLVDVSLRDVIAKNKVILDSLDDRKPVILVLNKIDQIKKPELLKIVQEFNDVFPYKAFMMISALKGDGIEDLKSVLAKNIPVSEFMFDPEDVTDMPMRLMAAEITREKVYDQLHRELPYAIYIDTEEWEDFDNGDLRISQVVYVQRSTQKGIVLGKGGQQIKKIGERARIELEQMMGRRVHLKLFVKVQENWPERSEFYNAVGLTLPS